MGIVAYLGQFPDASMALFFWGLLSGQILVMALVGAWSTRRRAK